MVQFRFVVGNCPDYRGIYRADDVGLLCRVCVPGLLP
jgi:hypothetical protein